MSNFRIRFATLKDLDEIQNLFNHPDIIAGLGGFTMRDQIRDCIKVRPSLWVADLDDKIVGAHMFGGRPQSHMIKLGHVGVLPEYRRQRIETSLYFTAVAQAVLEGRRLIEDTIVGDNEAQKIALPTMGFRLAGELVHRTGSEKSIFLYQLSLLWDKAWSLIYSRCPPDLWIELKTNSYTSDLWEKNMTLYTSKNSKASTIVVLIRKFLEGSPNVQIFRE